MAQPLADPSSCWGKTSLPSLSAPSAVTSFSKVSSKAVLEHCGVCLGFCCAGADVTQSFRRQWVLLMASMHSESSISEFKRQFIYLLQNLHNLPLIRNRCTTDIMYRVIHHQSRQEQADSCYLAYCVSAKISSTLRERQNHLASTSQLYSYQQFWLLFGGCGKWDTERVWGGDSPTQQCCCLDARAASALEENVRTWKIHLGTKTAFLGMRRKPWRS